jgi:hypothetical protein
MQGPDQRAISVSDRAPDAIQQPFEGVSNGVEERDHPIILVVQPHHRTIAPLHHRTLAPLHHGTMAPLNKDEGRWAIGEGKRAKPAEIPHHRTTQPLHLGTSPPWHHGTSQQR